MTEGFVFAAFAFGLLGQFYDAHTTDKGISSGKAVEANPVMAWLLKHFSMTGLYVFKCVVIAQAVPVLAYVMNGSTYGFWAAFAAGASGWFGAIWNGIQAKKAGAAPSVWSGIFS
jgi:hypothetical protein